MSYTNQDQYDTTGATGNSNNTSGQFGTTGDHFDNTKGGNSFGVSRDPNNFSAIGNTDDLNDFGNTQSSDFSNTGRTGLGSTDAATTGFSSGGTTVGGTDMYGAQSGRDVDDRKMDASENTMAGYGEARTGTGFSTTSRDTTAASDDIYGNYTGSAGRMAVPPTGFRGGANDPAYQPGQHYDHKAGGLVRDDGADLGQTGVATGHTMLGQRSMQPIDTEDTLATSTGVGSGAGTQQREKGEAGFGSTGGANDTGFGQTTRAGVTASTFDNSATSKPDNGASEFSTGASDFGTTTTNTNASTGTNRGFNAGQEINTSGGGEGWKSGMTGLTEEEVKQVQKGRHAPSAVDAHPNPNAMDSYDV